MTKNIKEEILEILERRESKMYSYYKSVFVDGFEGGYPANYDIEIIEDIDKVREQTIEECEKCVPEMQGNFDSRNIKDVKAGYNLCRTQILANLQALKKQNGNKKTTSQS